MVKLASWQWIVLIAPIAFVVGLLLISAGIQIHAWGLSWIWAIVGLVFVGWRWLLVRWTKPVLSEVEAAMAELAASLPEEQTTPRDPARTALTPKEQAEAQLQRILEESSNDPPIWADWVGFWNRCLSLISAIALVYAPQAKQPLLNIYVPQAYGLLRGTIDDLDEWMEKLAPILNQLTIAQAYEGYEIYQKLAPSARKAWKLWQWARWLVNPAAAAANTATRGWGNRANEELIGNLSQLLRTALLQNLAQGAIALYSSPAPPTEPIPAPSKPASSKPIAPVNPTQPSLPEATQSLQTLIRQSVPTSTIDAQPLNLLLLGRTGAGKSSLINTLFQHPKAAVDILPSTDRLQAYKWDGQPGSSNAAPIQLWDTPGYEQVDRPDLRAQVIERAQQSDLILLVTPALDPALQMDLDCLQAIQSELPDRIPLITIVTQVDRLRPIREWSPPYNWETGTRPKEQAIRDAIQYRQEILAQFQTPIFPLVTLANDRPAWGIDPIAQHLITQIDPTQQARLARILNSITAQAIAAQQLIDRYQFQLTTTQGLTTLLKSPILTFLSTLTTGSPALGTLLATQIPIEQLPLVLGKLQLAYDLYHLLSATPARPNPLSFDLLPLWEIVLESSGDPSQDAKAFGQLMVEYWTGAIEAKQLSDRLSQLFTVA